MFLYKLEAGKTTDSPSCPSINDKTVTIKKLHFGKAENFICAYLKTFVNKVEQNNIWARFKELNPAVTDIKAIYGSCQTTYPEEEKNYTCICKEDDTNKGNLNEKVSFFGSSPVYLCAFNQIAKVRRLRKKLKKYLKKKK